MDKRTLPHKQNEIRRNEARQLKQGGATYAQIGEQMGISRQRAQQLVAPPQKQAKAIIAETGGICSVCGCIANKIELHHTDYSTDELSPVCTACHRRLHNMGKTQNRYKNPGRRGRAPLGKDGKRGVGLSFLLPEENYMAIESLVTTKKSRSDIARQAIEEYLERHYSSNLSQINELEPIVKVQP